MFGGICKETKECFAVLVPDRKKETLWPVLAARVAEGSFLYTDSAKVYVGVEELGFTHFIINHSNHKTPYVRHIVYQGLVYSVHTNQIERLWRTLKLLSNEIVTKL